MRVLFETRLNEVIFPDGSAKSVPWEIPAQAEIGEEIDTVHAWCRKAGILRHDDELVTVMPAA
jgi:hypothetical protein